MADTGMRAVNVCDAIGPMNVQQKGKQILSALVVAVLMLPIALSVVSPVWAAADTTLYFNPASANPTVGDDFDLVATVNPGTNAVSAVEMHVTFDQTKLRLDGIAASSSFSLELAAASINNTNGTASIALAVPLASPSVTTTTAVATFSFHALATATNSQVAFTTASLASADSESGNAIATRTPASVTIAPLGSDTTAPVRSAGSPSGALAAGTTSTSVSLTTDEFATCKYATTAGIAYASMTNTFTTTAGTTHSFTASGLANGGSYAYSVRCEDGSTNENTDDYTISFTVAAAASSSSDDDDGGKKKKSKVSPRKLTNSTKSVARGGTIVQRGKKFSKNSIVALYFSKPNGTYYPPMMVKTGPTGAFMVKYRVNKPAGKYGWYAIDTRTGKKSKTIFYSVK